MKKKAFIKNVLLKCPNLGSLADGYFYLKSMESVLSGFYLEKTPRGGYIWKFIYPLFDMSEELHLTYSQRVTGQSGFIEKLSGYSGEQLADVFLSRVESYQKDLGNVISADGFNRYILSYDELLGNPIIRATFSYSNILTGDFERAEKELQHAINKVKEYGDDISYLGPNVEKVYNMLKQAPSDAQHFLNEVILNQKITLGISSD